MEKPLLMLNNAPDSRQSWKIRHTVKDVIAIVLFASLANAGGWMEIHAFAEMNEELLRKYLELENGIPSHDTIQRVMAVVPASYLQSLQSAWNEMLSENEGEKLKRILAIDGKTMRGSGNANTSPLHVLSAFAAEEGLCLGRKVVKEKSNEIAAIPELLKSLSIRGAVITIDAMGAQMEIARQIIRLKGNQPSLLEDVKDYFDDPELRGQCGYFKTVEKARSSAEVREYWQTDDTAWLPGKAKWKGLKSIGMTRNTVTKGEKQTSETRYFISSTAQDAREFARCVRGHWKIESFHWHLDVTFREDANHTLEKNAALNLNIIRKFSLSVLGLAQIGKPKTSMKLKRFYVSLKPERFLEQILSL